MANFDILKHDDRFRYMLLSRMQGDCKYYLGNGGRAKKHLWSLDEKEHIDNMKALWKSFDEDKKPEWLSWEEIMNYEHEMVGDAK